MILDWKRQCERIKLTNKLDRDDPSDNKIFFKQEVVYIRYLKNSGLSYEECQEKWEQLENGVAKKFIKDREQLDSQFRKTYLKASSRTYSFISSSEELNPIQIFEPEIRKINSLQCERWVKEYVLTLLIFNKFSSQLAKGVEYSPSLTNWALRQVNKGAHKFRSYNDARKSIMNALRNARFKVIKFTPIKKKGKYSTYIIPFSCEEGEVVFEIDSLSNLKDAFCLLRNDNVICQECGKIFPINSKTKRILCEECYKKYRRKYKTQKDRIYYQKKKNPDTKSGILVYE